MQDKTEKYRAAKAEIEASTGMPLGTRMQKAAEILQNSFGNLWSGFYIVDRYCGIPADAENLRSAENRVNSERGHRAENLSRAGKEEGASEAGPTLILGPNVGPPACERIRFGRGVCGSAWKEKRTLIVPDVEKFPGHIACSSESKSEIVVPIMSSGEVLGVIDIDSRSPSAFDVIDAQYIEEIAALLSEDLARNL